MKNDIDLKIFGLYSLRKLQFVYNILRKRAKLYIEIIGKRD